MMGRVEQLGERLVISAELVNVEDGSRIWGDQYHRQSSDIFSVQEELAREISEKLCLRLSGEQKERLRKRSTENREAYEFYLRGRYAWGRRTNEELKAGVEYFRQAISMDANYSQAHAGIADCLVLLGQFGAEHPQLIMPQAKAAATTAIQLDETLGEAYASLAQTKFIYEWDWAGAEENFQQALRLSPTYPTAHQWHGEYLASMGLFDQGLAELKRARDLDPLSLIINTNLGLTYYWARRYDLAIDQLKTAIQLEPNFFRAHLHLGMVYERKSMEREAIAELRKAMSINETPWTLAGLAYAYASFGERAKAKKLLARLIVLSRSQYVSCATIAVVYAGFEDEVDKTIELLEKAYEERSGLLIWLKVWSVFDNLRSDARFVRLLRRIGFTTDGERHELGSRLDKFLIQQPKTSTRERRAGAWEPQQETIEQQLLIRSTENAEAYRAYLKGRYYWSKFTHSSLEKAIDSFQHAVDLDPGYAMAYVGIADSSTRLATSFVLPTEVMPKAKKAVLKALEIDENIAEAHATLGKLKMDYEWDWEGAAQEFRRAFALKPEYATAHLWYSSYLNSLGRFDEALAENQQALELNPLSLHIRVSIGFTLWLMHRCGEALESINEAVEMDTNFPLAHLVLAFVKESNRDFSDAVANLEKAREIDDAPILLPYLGRAYAMAGREAEAMAIVDKLQAQTSRRYFSAYSVALILSALGAVDLTFDWLEKAYEYRDEGLCWLNVDPRLEHLHTDDRFKDLARRIFSPRARLIGVKSGSPCFVV